MKHLTDKEIQEYEQLKKDYGWGFDIPDLNKPYKPSGIFAAVSSCHEPNCDKINCTCSIRNICESDTTHCIER